MAEIVQNAITPQQIKLIKDHYDSLDVDAHTPNFSNNKNLEYHIDTDISFQIFNPIFQTILGDHEFDTGAYKQSLQPYGIHTDARSKHQQLGIMLFGQSAKHNKAIICPLDSGSNFKTLVFKHANDQHPYEIEIDDNILIETNGLDFADYQHCGEEVTHLEIDIEYTWNAGDLLLFNRDQWHCSNYFKTTADTKHFLIFFIA